MDNAKCELGGEKAENGKRQLDDPVARSGFGSLHGHRPGRLQQAPPARHADPPSLFRQRSHFLAYRNHAGLYADFHSIRRTFITNLCRADVLPKTAQTLARHSDIRLTMEVYTHVDRGEQVDAIRKLKAPEGGAA